MEWTWAVAFLLSVRRTAGAGRYGNAILTTPDEKGISTKSGSLVAGSPARAKGKRKREHKGGKV